MIFYGMKKGREMTLKGGDSFIAKIRCFSKCLCTHMEKMSVQRCLYTKLQIRALTIIRNIIF